MTGIASLVNNILCKKIFSQVRMLQRLFTISQVRGTGGTGGTHLNNPFTNTDWYYRLSQFGANSLNLFILITVKKRTPQVNTYSVVLTTETPFSPAHAQNNDSEIQGWCTQRISAKILIDMYIYYKKRYILQI